MKKLSTSEGSSEAKKSPPAADRKTLDFSEFDDSYIHSIIILSEPFSAPSEFLFYQ